MTKRNDLSVVVLAAGEGRRMQPLGADIPKVMIPILGKPVLAYVLQNFIDIGFKKVTVVLLGETADYIKKYFKNNWNGLSINYLEIKKPNGPSYALNAIKNHIKTAFFLVQFADSLADENIPKKIIERFDKNPQVDGVITVREVDDPSRYGMVRYKNNQIVEIIDKPHIAPSSHATVGTFILKTAFFKKSLQNQKFTYKNQLFPAEYMLRLGATIDSYFFDGQRVDVGKPENLFDACLLLAKKPVKCIAFDADNTLYNSHQTAPIADIRAMQLLSERVKKNSQNLYKEWQLLVDKIKNSSDPKVRTRHYSYGMLCKNYGLDQAFAQNMYELFTNVLLKNLNSPKRLKEILQNLLQEKYVLTDDITTLATKKLKRFGLEGFFKEFITSDIVGITKPSKKFYNVLLKKFQPEEILVVGDNWRKDLEIPAKLGMQVLFVENEKSLEKLLALRGPAPNQLRSRRIHIMGIGGAGAAAIAGIAKGYGYQVSGCDIASESSYTKNIGLAINKGHSKSHVKDLDLLVISPAVSKLDPKNEELLRAKQLRIPVLTWQKFQGQYLQKDKFVICVSGAYGKSTTSAMTAQILIDAGIDPTCEIGAKVLSWQSNFRVGQSKYYVCEGDEYNNNFLNYHPDIAVILNTGWDHPDFFKKRQDVLASFQKFTENFKFGGILITSGHFKVRDDINLKKIEPFGKLKLSLIGDFRVQNANAALTVAKTLGLDLEKAKISIANFKGVGRRLEYKGQVKNTKFYDDYAVQPYTIQKTADALKEKYKSKIVLLVLEPHTFSRIETFFDDFVKSLKISKIDQIFITDVFAAREKGDKITLSKKLAKAIGKKAKFTGSIAQTANYLKSQMKNYDIVCSMGAGDIYKLYDLVK